MTPDTALKLAALDGEDLVVISAHVQDAVLHVGDLIWSPARNRFAFVMNRFAWEAGGQGRRRTAYQRRRAAVHFDRVISVRSTGIDRARPDRVLSLLAIEFSEGDAPAGEVKLVFAGGAEIRLEVECIEAQLADIGGVWQTGTKPAHGLESGDAPAPASR